MKIDAECHCGKIAYQAEVDPDMLVLCHCTDCQTIAGSPYRAVIPAPAETFKLLRGEPKIYSKIAESGNKIVHSFCGDCGTAIYASATNNSRYGLRIGAIKQRAQLRPRMQIWYRSALPWAMDLSAVEKHSTQPSFLTGAATGKSN
jgi:hypothetical protein